MTFVTHSILVPYSTEQMFNLINNINAYKEFIPGCISSKILEQNNEKLIAKVSISRFGISKSFVTYNINIKNKSIVMHLIKGPFNALAGYWQFIELNEKISKVEFCLDFEFKNTFTEIIFNRIFKETTNNILTVFINRAKKVYQKGG